MIMYSIDSSLNFVYYCYDSMAQNDNNSWLFITQIMKYVEP